MSVMSKHLQEYMGDSETQKKQWMQHFGVNAAGDIVNKKRHDSAVAGMVVLLTMRVTSSMRRSSKRHARPSKR